MFVELPKGSFSKVKPLLGDLSHYLVLSTLLQGSTTGRIWVDDENAPATAFIWDRLNTFFFLLGDSGNDSRNRELNHLITDTILPAALQQQYDRFFLQFSPLDRWRQHAGVVLEGMVSVERLIISFTLPPGSTTAGNTASGNLPSGYRLARIDREMVSSSSLSNLDAVKGVIKACWGSASSYLDRGGTGFCLLGDEGIASFCSTEHIVDAECDLYVETFEGHRHKGLGTLVAEACIQECLASGLVVRWHCFEANVGSMKIAQTLGLTRTADCPVFIVDL